MSVRDWLPHPLAGTAAVIAIGLLGIALHNNYGKPHDGDAAYQEAASCAACGAGIAPVVSRYTPPPEPYPERKEWREERDLQAQRDMAKYSLLMMVAAFASVGTAFYGVVLLKQTLDATRKMAFDASQATAATVVAANAARQGNAITQQALKAEQRPWIAVNIVADSPLRWEDGSGLVGFNFVVRNFGKTPARNVQVFAKMYVTGGSNKIPRVEQIQFSDLNRKEPEHLLSANVFPGESRGFPHTLQIKKEEIDAFQNWQRDFSKGRFEPMTVVPVALIGSAHYRSIFGSEVFETGFIYDLYRSVRGVPEPRVVDMSDGTIDPRDLRLMDNIFGPGRIT